jgi:hypothetical protein
MKIIDFIHHAKKEIWCILSIVILSNFLLGYCFVVIIIGGVWGVSWLESYIVEVIAYFGAAIIILFNIWVVKKNKGRKGFSIKGHLVFNVMIPVIGSLLIKLMLVLEM